VQNGAEVLQCRVQTVGPQQFVDRRLDVRQIPISRYRPVKLAETVKLTASGKPRGLRALIEAAALANRYRENVVLSSPPPAMQRLLFPLLARFAASNRERAPVGAR
jgi:hypothetical protein